MFNIFNFNLTRCLFSLHGDVNVELTNLKGWCKCGIKWVKPADFGYFAPFISSLVDLSVIYMVIGIQFIFPTLLQYLVTCLKIYSTIEMFIIHYVFYLDIMNEQLKCFIFNTSCVYCWINPQQQYQIACIYRYKSNSRKLNLKNGVGDGGISDDHPFAFNLEWRQTIIFSFVLWWESFSSLHGKSTVAYYINKSYTSYCYVAYHFKNTNTW